MLKKHIMLVLGLTLAAPAWVQTGEDFPKPFTMNLPLKADQPRPGWLGQSQLTEYYTFNTVHFRIAPVPDSDLALTFYYQETEGGFLRVYWTSAQSAEMIAPNLYEGTSLPNQRTLLVNRTVLTSPGVLTVQYSGSPANLRRLRWEWVRAAIVLSSEETPVLTLVARHTPLLTMRELQGALETPPDEWEGTVFSASLTEKPERIEEGVTFAVPLEGLPRQARMEFKVSGLPMEARLATWINDQYAGEASVEVPHLANPAYVDGPDGQPVFHGWRNATIFIPTRLLRVGDNRIQFDISGLAASAQAPGVAVKDLVLQLRFPPATPELTPPSLEWNATATPPSP